MTKQERERLLHFREINRKKPLCFSPETQDSEVTSYIGIKSKSYSLETKCLQGKTGWKFAMKGMVRKNFLDWKHETFVKYLLGKKKFYLSYNHTNICIKDHKLYLKSGKKHVCNRYYSKRYMLPDGISTLAYGNPAIEFYRDVEACLEELLNKVSNV